MSAHAQIAGLGNPVPPHLGGPVNPKAIVVKAVAWLRGRYKSEPARVVALGAAVIVFAAAKGGLVVPEAGVAQALALALPVLFGGEVTRRLVTPTS